ncbi:hypothetical protein [Terrarubrum flagellatum]|uniref:peptidoglycan-binding domain-containing protein n=1 Tax=Terrirubrum flagellatum TaxID=2895980 RepID=UPI0031452F45
MSLRSNLFTGDKALEAASANHKAHIMRGAIGTHVRRIQVALSVLDNAVIAENEMASFMFGPTTAAAVLAYKRARDIVNHSYQSQADDIVGIMTVAVMDKELFENEVAPERSRQYSCRRRCLCVTNSERKQAALAIAQRMSAHLGRSLIS